MASLMAFNVHNTRLESNRNYNVSTQLSILTLPYISCRPTNLYSAFCLEQMLKTLICKLKTIKKTCF